jgi:enoyl-CoA hydratase/carnithine racemase
MPRPYKTAAHADSALRNNSRWTHALHDAAWTMRALALVGPIVACSVSSAQTPAAPLSETPAAVSTIQATPGAKVRITKRSATYWRVTLDNPPLNIIGASEVKELAAVVAQIEADPQVQVIVFDSAVPGYFSAHYDLLSPLTDTTGMAPGRTGLPAVTDVMVRLSRLPIVTIASIRGRATGIGSELILACDMRYASREKAVLSQFEVSVGFVAGGGPMVNLARLVGRGRAMEIMVGSDDINGDIAERYGYVNRSLPDAQLDRFVDDLALRIASFDRQAIIDTKKLVDVASLPPEADMKASWDAFLVSVQRPGAQARLKALVAKGLQKPGDIEEHLGRHAAEYPK